MISASCDLCRDDSYYVLPRLITGPQRIVICRSCGLIYTHPSPTSAEIEAIYRDTFADDLGAPSRTRHDVTANHQLSEQFKRHLAYVQSTLMPWLLDYINPAGKRWIELRFRSGALLQELRERGAIVGGIDLFEKNVNWVRENLQIRDVRQATVHNMLEGCDDRVDVFSMLTVHVLSHVPSPRDLLAAMFERLEPGGVLVLQEKDVLHLSGELAKFPLTFPEGLAHYHHLTLNATKIFVENAGFKVVSVRDLSRDGSLGRFGIIAVKPKSIEAATQCIRKEIAGREVRSRIVNAYIQYQRRRIRRTITTGGRRLLGTFWRSPF